MGHQAVGVKDGHSIVWSEKGNGWMMEIANVSGEISLSIDKGEMVWATATFKITLKK